MANDSSQIMIFKKFIPPIVTKQHITPYKSMSMDMVLWNLEGGF